MSSRSVSNKAGIALPQVEGASVTNLRINTICNFQTIKSPVESNRLLSKLLCHVRTFGKVFAKIKPNLKFKIFTQNFYAMDS